MASPSPTPSYGYRGFDYSPIWGPAKPAENATSNSEAPQRRSSATVGRTHKPFFLANQPTTNSPSQTTPPKPVGTDSSRKQEPQSKGQQPPARVDWEKKATELDVLSKRYRKERDDAKKELDHTRTLCRRAEDQLRREKAEAVAAKARDSEVIEQLKRELEGGSWKEEVAVLQRQLELANSQAAESKKLSATNKELEGALAESQRRLAQMEEKVGLAIVEIQEQKANCRDREVELFEANGIITRMEFDTREYKVEKEDLEQRLSLYMDECRGLERELEARDEEGGV